MTQEQFIERACAIYAEEAKTGKPLSSRDMKVAYQAISKAMLEAMLKGEPVHLACNIGSFYATNHSERKGRNPRTGDEITIPARKSVKFRPGKTLKDALNGHGTEA